LLRVVDLPELGLVEPPQDGLEPERTREHDAKHDRDNNAVGSDHRYPLLGCSTLAQIVC